MDAITIREFRPDDLEPITSLTLEAFAPVTLERNIEQLCGTLNEHDWKWRKARHIQADVAREGSQVFVAESGSQVVGYITTYVDREAGVGFIPNLAVDASIRGQGIGRQLIERALAHFRQCGAAAARIETLEQNPIGQHLYPSLGFQEAGRQIHYCLSLTGDAAPNEASDRKSTDS